MRSDLQRLARATRGFMPHEEGLALYRAACAAAGAAPSGAAPSGAAPSGAAPAATIVEIGSYCGKSTVYLGAAAAAAGAVVVTVDHHRGSEEMQAGWTHHDAELVDPRTGRIDSLARLRRTLEEARLEDVVVAVVGRSSTVAEHWDAPVAMLFVDGGHGTEPAHADYESWTPKLVPGGTLAVHDVFPNPADGGRPPFEIYCRALDDGFTECDAVGSLRVLRAPSSPLRPR